MDGAHLKQLIAAPAIERDVRADSGAGFRQCAI